ncbi:hypothetical protein BT63DRAFT_306972 [Microthyrium microscopicum]|uniref:DUF7730 domain-containing protein n=1 Tax=Microthyrium microscopicum TaxID=703497 RepID=A0A6A6U8S1_9PEZI|nr:hypothetical protein BT63DRAFT_306972 [Microthyrium microscopicum]
MSSSSNFLSKLPLEIRQMIYAFALASQEMIVFHAVPNNRNNGQNTPTFKIHRSPGSRLNLSYQILQTCQQVYEEAKDILHHCNTFSLEDPNWYDPQSATYDFSPEQMSLIRHLSIRFHDWEEIESLAQYVADHLVLHIPKLRRLDCQFLWLEDGNHLYHASHPNYATERFRSISHLQQERQNILDCIQKLAHFPRLKSFQCTFPIHQIELVAQFLSTDGDMAHDELLKWSRDFSVHRKLMTMMIGVMRTRNYLVDVPLAWRFHAITAFDSWPDVFIVMIVNKLEHDILCQVTGDYGVMSGREPLEQ